MHLLLLLPAIFVIATARVINERKPNEPVLPELNPNIQRDFDGQKRNWYDPPQAIETSDAIGASDPNCNAGDIIRASGNDLVNKIRAAGWRCINDNIFGLKGTDANQGCNEADMAAVANGLTADISQYDPNNPQKTPGIHALATYAKACLFVAFYQAQDVPKYSSNLIPLFQRGFDLFLQKPNLESKNDEHVENLGEMIILISSAGLQRPYIVRLSQLYTKLSNAYTFPSGNSNQANAINAFYDHFFRVHGYTQAEKDEATAIFKQNPDVPKCLSDFMDKHRELLGTSNEWILRNAALELGRFLQQVPIRPKVSEWMKRQLQQYSAKGSERVWTTLAGQVMDFDAQDCASFGVCNFKAELQTKILPYTKTCQKSRTDTFIIRAQSITDQEADQVCNRLKAEETYFHDLVQDQWRPVSPDTNSNVEVVIYNDRDSYQLYARIMFGIDTNNGGMYLEGDPSKSGNVARYLCYESPYSSQFDVWNLEHEFVHYLDGRYDMQGDFQATSNIDAVWWGEGFAEYASKKNQSPTMVQKCKDKRYPLSTLFKNRYGVGDERIYEYGYLSVRFMFEKHRNDVSTILGYFRNGKYQDYQNWLNGIGSKYDQEFNKWCDCLVVGKTC